MHKTTLIALLLLSSTFAGAQTPEPLQSNSSATGSATAKPQNRHGDLDRIVCEKQDTIGTRLGAHKVCLTVAQWQEFQREEQSQMLRIEQNIGLGSH